MRTTVDFIPDYVLDKENAPKTGMAKIIIDQSTISTLMNADLQPESTKLLHMTIDYIDLPIKIVAIPEEAPGGIKFEVYPRYVEYPDAVEQDGFITWDPATGTPSSAIANNELAEEIKTTVVITYYFLILYLATTDDYKEYDTTDLELENLLVYADGDEIHSRIVYGKGRPDVLATGINVDDKYVRPCSFEDEKIKLALGEHSPKGYMEALEMFDSEED